MTETSRSRKGSAFILWIVALLVAAGASIYQRRTGPTHPLRGSFSLNGREISYRLVRSDSSDRTNRRTRLELPVIDEGISGVLQYKRYGTDDPFTVQPLTEEASPADGAGGATDQPSNGKAEGEGQVLVGYLPAQPAAGKLEYFFLVTTTDQPSQITRIPEKSAGNVVIRYKDRVPGVYLGLHIALVFLALIFGVRAGLAALFTPELVQRWAWITLLFMTGGVAIFGPIVQKYAFGEFWTGWPYGYDWTDNKAAIMWLAWLVGCLVLRFSGPRRQAVRRVVILLAAVTMLAAFVIPHSYRGSTLDYGLIDKGVDPAEAIKTGK